MHKGRQEGVEFGYKATTTSGIVFNFFSALGDVAFAYAGHNVVLEIQATIPSTPEKPSKKPMWKGVVVAYIVVAICYFPVALIGYWAFGNTVEDNILITLEKPRWLIAIANMFVVVHVIGSYQVINDTLSVTFFVGIIRSEAKMSSDTQKDSLFRIYYFPYSNPVLVLLADICHASF